MLLHGVGICLFATELISVKLGPLRCSFDFLSKNLSANPRCMSQSGIRKGHFSNIQNWKGGEGKEEIETGRQEDRGKGRRKAEKGKREGERRKGKGKREKSEIGYGKWGIGNWEREKVDRV